MRLLLITQAVDKQDSVMGFMHNWINHFAQKFESIIVICLSKGEYDLPSNVKVLSLGKEEGVSKLTYIWRFYKYIFQEFKNYDRVFVHMNQEYVLLAGDLWRLMGKRVYLWRNHPDGTWLTNVAVWLSNKVFCTSPQSYTARFKKTVLMPVGVDTNFFKPDPDVVRMPNSILMLGRIAPIKKNLEFIEWLNTEGAGFTATIAGGALPRDREYEELVRAKASDRVKFIGPVNQAEAVKLYQAHEFFVNKTPAGSFDKTILEAHASGCKLMVDNPVAQNLDVNKHSLNYLCERLVEELR